MQKTVEWKSLRSIVRLLIILSAAWVLLCYYRAEAAEPSGLIGPKGRMQMPLKNTDGMTQTPIVEVTKEDRISVKAENRPLGEILRMMAETRLFDLRGQLPQGEAITLSFSGLSIDQALKKVMRGYNYVLMEQGAAQRPLLVVMGRAERSNPAELVVPQPLALPVNQALDPKSYYVPPSTVEPPSTAVSKALPAGAPGSKMAPGPPAAQPVDRKGRQQREADKEPPADRHEVATEAKGEGRVQEGQTESLSDQTRSGQTGRTENTRPVQ